jgi:hypothetical protein
MTFSIWTALLVFCACSLLDVVFTYYTLCIVRCQPIKAATASAGVGLLGGIAILNYVHQPVYLAFAAAGYWLGTYGTLKWEQYRKRKIEDRCTTGGC